MSKLITKKIWFITILVFVVIISYTTGINADHENDDFDFGKMFGKKGKSQFCPQYQCSPGYTPIPKAKTITSLESSGCQGISSNSGGMPLMKITGDVEEEPYEQCCHEWHACYLLCGVSKQTCDDTFEKCSFDICNALTPTADYNKDIYDDDSSKKDSSPKEKCVRSVGLQILMMTFSRCTTFDRQQTTACDCIKKDYDDDDDKQLNMKRKAIVKSFYETYAPDSINKVTQLMSKIDTNMKLVGLLQKLIHKYPQSIKKVKPSHNLDNDLYESIMKKGEEIHNRDKEKKKNKDEDMKNDEDDKEEDVVDERVEL